MEIHKERVKAIFVEVISGFALFDIAVLEMGNGEYTVNMYAREARAWMRSEGVYRAVSSQDVLLLIYTPSLCYSSRWWYAGSSFPSDKHVCFMDITSHSPWASYCIYFHCPVFSQQNTGRRHKSAIFWARRTNTNAELFIVEQEHLGFLGEAGLFASWNEGIFPPTRNSLIYVKTLLYEKTNEPNEAKRIDQWTDGVRVTVVKTSVDLGHSLHNGTRPMLIYRWQPLKKWKTRTFPLYLIFFARRSFLNTKKLLRISSFLETYSL